MEVIFASICLFAMTGGILFYEHDKMMNLVKIAENKQHNIEKLRKNFAKGRKNF
jgi:hypothetical protein